MRKLLILGTLVLGAPLSACRPSSDSSSAPPTPGPAAPQAKLTPKGRGFIEGQVRLTGTPPPVAMLETNPTVASACGDKVPDRSLSIGEGGALAHVVVALAERATFSGEGPPTAPPVLDQRKCSYEPPILAARAGTTLEVRNSDPVMHNVRAVAGAQSVFNVAMPLEGMSLKKPLPATAGTLQVKCDVHPWMRAVVRTFDHPYFTTTDAQGRFRLEVPEGAHTLVLWHPRLPEASRPVSVQSGQTVQLEQAWAVDTLR